MTRQEAYSIGRSAGIDAHTLHEYLDCDSDVNQDKFYEWMDA